MKINTKYKKRKFEKYFYKLKYVSKELKKDTNELDESIRECVVGDIIFSGQTKYYHSPPYITNYFYVHIAASGKYLYTRNQWEKDVSDEVKDYIYALIQQQAYHQALENTKEILNGKITTDIWLKELLLKGNGDNR